MNLRPDDVSIVAGRRRCLPGTLKELADPQPGDEEEEKTKSYFGPDVKVDTLKVKEGGTISTRGGVTGEAKSQGDELRSARDDVFSALEEAIEKTLTKEENEVVSKFFAGKIPYDQNVLNVLDRVLDKTIDYLQTHGANLDPETKRLIEKRKADYINKQCKKHQVSTGPKCCCSIPAKGRLTMEKQTFVSVIHHFSGFLLE
ncbi:hypothetical protein ANCDUO_15878 [Ancylostoma duodenale]|uniref:Uncharacterized protein n=1 Tax=Ancylostoma duodenale TaxID=51022 RepID=A0A0C2CVS6_9BILA|nr:hypothetical protein ANCDUO_15878 [Ancylostoma duodenale]